MRIGYQALKVALNEFAKRRGASVEEAEIFATCHATADLRGHHTQGVHIIPILDKAMKGGVENFGRQPLIVNEGPAYAVMEAQGGVGTVSATRGMALAVEKAKSNGIGCAWVRNGGVFCMASNYTLQAIKSDCVGLAAANGVPFVAPWGGRDPFFSTNPFSIAVPSERHIPIVIDMSAGSFSAGAVMSRLRDGALMDTPHLVSSQGLYTDDPKMLSQFDTHVFEAGGIVAQGPRGFGWMIFVEIMAGLLAGMNASCSNSFEPDKGAFAYDIGQFFMALDPSKLVETGVFHTRVDDMIAGLLAARPAAGFEKVKYPGEEAGRKQMEYLKFEIPIDDRDWNAFIDLD